MKISVEIFNEMGENESVLIYMDMDVRAQITFLMGLLKLKILIVHTDLSCRFKQVLLCFLYINLVLTQKEEYLPRLQRGNHWKLRSD